ncbi:MAG: DUF1549 domain-containing protein [Planctomycetales bacterium]|nr:DUF1549 domain-containing protein [Planctomycetales bacterium]
MIVRASVALGVLLILSKGAAIANDTIARQNAIAMGARIDELLETEWRSREIVPSRIADDSEFLRRISLDLIGVIPTAGEVRRFNADRTSKKRQTTVDTLLESPRHSTHLANLFREIIMPSSGNDPFNGTAELQQWLREQFVDNMRYDRIVSEFLASTGSEQGPAAFYRSLEAKPEKLASTTSRVFLGLQLECAQCHDHPFDNWTQKEFWGYAAFFARIQQPTAMTPNFSVVDVPDGEVTIPDTEQVVAPKYPRGPHAPEDARGTRRIQLSIWMASRDNPFLPRAAVNRVWSFMFGKGLVNPVDDIGPHNPPLHPRLMDELTEYFIEQDFSLKELFRAIAYSDTYQRSSQLAGDSNSEIELFERMHVKTLSPDQLYDSLSRALLQPAEVGIRREFVNRMKTVSRDSTEYAAGLQQALNLMNGQRISTATSQSDNGLMGALNAPFLHDQQRVESAFLTVVSRLPSDEEAQLFVQHISARTSNDERQSAMSDIIWALTNSAEFQLNH